MGARPHDAAFVKDDDPIGVTDGGDTLGDDDDRRVPEGFAESAPHRGIGFVVEGGEAVVARAMARRWRWPPDTFAPPWLTDESTPSSLDATKSDA